MALIVTPERPIYDWLGDLDEWTKDSPGFLADRPVILDLSAVTLSDTAIAHVIGQLAQRGVRVMAIEGVDPAARNPNLPPVLGRNAAVADGEAPRPAPPRAAPEPERKPTSLLVNDPIRSGQSIIFPDGDVTVLGSVGSGAEIIAGGSIHVYGTLRGRAAAGSKGDKSARIFCRRNEAEILSIAGRYRTAETMDRLRGRPVQAWLDRDEVRVEVLEEM